MIKYSFILLLSLITVQKAQAQKDTLLYFLKNTGEIVAKENADYFMMILPQDVNNSKPSFPMLQYYMNGNRKLISATRSRTKLAYNGGTLSFFPNGKRKSSGVYNNGKPNGIITEYYPNGKVFTIVNYKNPDNPRLIECRDSTGVITTENGNGEWLKWSENYENLISTKTVKNGIMKDLWMDFIPRGRPGLASITSEISSNNDSLKVDSLPGYSYGITAFNNFLSRNIRYPVIDREKNIQGVVVLNFTVQENGELTNFKILKSASKNIDAEALRVLKLSSPWLPAKVMGKAVSHEFTQSIAFTLGKE